MTGRRRTVVSVLLTIGALVLVPAAAAAPPPPDEPAAPYRVGGLESAAERSEVARSGVDVLGGGREHLEIRATPAEAALLRDRGLQLRALPQPSRPRSPTPGRFPPGYTGYHTYRELLVELAESAAAYPDRVAVSSYGESSEGRDLPLVKVSDEVGTDEDEPEVLFTCNQHAREHLTAEMCLHIVQRLAAAPQLVDDREVWVMPMTNPDGAVHDIARGSFELWRKNRQPTEGSSQIGTDLNRNWGHRWGCCDGSSGDPADGTYRGPTPFSAPETAQLRDWVGGRVFDGEQQITAHIDWHTFSELVLWPYGYTESDTGPGLDASDAATFRELGEAMAATNGYTPQQSSALYVTDGSVNDWMWAQHGIWSFTVEMYPESQAEGGFYPPDTVIERETTRNDAAVDLLLQRAAGLRSS